MATAQDAITNLQDQALEAIKSGQDAAVKAVHAWSDAIAKVTPGGAWPLGEFPSGVEETLGDPTAIVDSVYDFASNILALNKGFVHRLLEVTEPASGKPASTPAKAK